MPRRVGQRARAPPLLASPRAASSARTSTWYGSRVHRLALAQRGGQVRARGLGVAAGRGQPPEGEVDRAVVRRLRPGRWRAVRRTARAGRRGPAPSRRRPARRTPRHCPPPRSPTRGPLGHPAHVRRDGPPQGSASSRLPLALYIRQIQPPAKYGSLSTSGRHGRLALGEATAGLLRDGRRRDDVEERRLAHRVVLQRDRSSASRPASSHRPSSSRCEHSTRVRYARQDGRSSRATSGWSACSSASRSMRSPRTAKASIRHRRPHAAYSSVPVRLPRSTAWSAIASRSVRWSIAKRAACQAWSLRNVASGSSLSGGSTSGSGGPNGLAVATSWARTRAVRTGSLSPEPGERLDAELVDARPRHRPGRSSGSPWRRPPEPRRRRCDGPRPPPARTPARASPTAPRRYRSRARSRRSAALDTRPTVGAGDACFPRCGGPVRAPSVAA